MYPDLRPLGIGEILDRAVSLFVRRFAVLVLILALVAIPVAICQYIATPQLHGLFDEIARALSLPPGHERQRGQLLAAAIAHASAGPAGSIIALGAGILGTLSSTACVIAIAQSYAGRMPSVREVYRAAVARWLAQLVGIVFYVALAFIASIGILIVTLLAGFAIGVLAIASKLTATILAIPLAVIVVVALFGTFALLYLASQLTIVALALEETNPVRGIAMGLRRTFSKPVLWRSVRVAAALLLISAIGQFVLFGIAGTLSLTTHVTLLYPVITVVGVLMLGALVLTFVTLYAIDLRVRREGLDLIVAAREPTL